MSYIQSNQNLKTTDSITFASQILGAPGSTPTLATLLNLFSSTQNISRVILSGQEFNAPGNTSSDGIAFVLGINRNLNKQLWIMDSSQSAINSTNVMLRILIDNTPHDIGIDALATDGSTAKTLRIQPAGGATTIGGSLDVTGGFTCGNFTVNSYSPTIGDGTNNFTGLTQNGFYWTLGGWTYFTAWVQWTGKGSASGNVRVSLPSSINAASARYPLALGMANGLGITTQRSLSASADSGVNYCWMLKNTTGTGAILQVSECNTSGEVQVSGWYRN